MDDRSDTGNPRLAARAAEGDDGLELRSPGVGWWSSPIADRALVGPGSLLGRLRTAGRTVDLVVPEGVSGRIRGAPRDRRVAVEYDGRLCRLEAFSTDAKVADDTLRDEPDVPSDVPDGCATVVAPTDGVFYRRSGPDAPPFTEVGQSLSTGQPVGLIEVMKTYNQILYGGAGTARHADVVEIRPADGAEVSAGQILLVVRPRGETS